METLHHVHADDVAQAFVLAIQNRGAGLGESFNVVSPAALTLRGYAESIAEWFGRPARLTFAAWEQWRETVSADDATATWEHIARSPCHSIEKARRLLGYAPRYTSLEAVRESLTWLIDHGDLPAPGRPKEASLDGSREGSVRAGSSRPRSDSARGRSAEAGVRPTTESRSPRCTRRSMQESRSSIPQTSTATAARSG